MIRRVALYFLLFALAARAVNAGEITGPTSTDTSQPGHASLWQWSGSSVVVNDARGDWSAALKGYLKDHAASEREGKGAEFRKQLLLDYAARVHEKNEPSLSEVRLGSRDRAARAVAYDKGVMVFRMLEQLIGADQFNRGVKTFAQDNRDRPATWNDIRTAMEKASNRDLRPFFDQWVLGKGLPGIEAGNASVKRKGDDFEIQLHGLQSDATLTLDVPAVLVSAGGASKKMLLSLDRGKAVTLDEKDEPRTLVIDPAYDIARMPSVPETPPLIKTALAADQPLIVMPVTRLEAYVDAVDRFMQSGATQTDAAAVTNEDIKAASAVIVLGADNPVIARLFGSSEQIEAGFSMLARKNPWSKRSVILVVNSRSLAEAEAAWPAIESAGDFSAAAFSRGSRIFARTDESAKGVKMTLRDDPDAIDVSQLKTLPDAIRSAEKQRIVYVGEFHDKYEHHAVQLQVIRSLIGRGERIAIGMEMFQRPFQSVLDDYIAGRIDERTFLRKSEYFKRWGFDYSLYKPILDYARENGIPVVALNQRKEVTDKVAKSGLASLTEEEKKDVPPEMDFSDGEYRERLKAIFDQHQAPDRSFDHFFQAQVLWDETMAMSIDEFLKKQPDRRMIVLAGSGHLAYGSGIPRRCFRRNSLPYFIALNDADVDREIADYIILPEPLKGTPAPKLMVVLEVEGRRVVVKDLPADSVSRRAGIKTGDIVLALDGQNVQSVEDIRIELFFRKPGDSVNVTVLRKGFFFGEKTLVIPVKL